MYCINLVLYTGAPIKFYPSLQRVLEHCGGDSQGQCIIDEILQSACILAQDQYGNYVTQVKYGCNLIHSSSGSPNFYSYDPFGRAPRS
jgi:hypothetical protein